LNLGIGVGIGVVVGVAGRIDGEDPGKVVEQQRSAVVEDSIGTGLQSIDRHTAIRVGLGEAHRGFGVLREGFHTEPYASQRKVATGIKDTVEIRVTEDSQSHLIMADLVASDVDSRRTKSSTEAQDGKHYEHNTGNRGTTL
jgi:hypothetical protein